MLEGSEIVELCVKDAAMLLILEFSSVVIVAAQIVRVFVIVVLILGLHWFCCVSGML